MELEREPADANLWTTNPSGALPRTLLCDLYDPG